MARSVRSQPGGHPEPEERSEQYRQQARPPISIPPADDFADKFLNPCYWTVNTTVQPGGGTPGSASATEKNGRIELVGRAHLNTTNHFDPEIVGGIRITGRWTFAGSQDFLQILVRSDGVPYSPDNTCSGETQHGIEFFLNQNDLPRRPLQIGSNSSAIVVSQDTASGNTGSLASAAAGQSFDFEIVDDGTGLLSFKMTQVDNPASTTGVTRRVVSDNFTRNRIVFHNREGGNQKSYLENVSITRIPPPRPRRWSLRAFRMIRPRAT